MFALGQDFFAAGMLDRAESVFLELLESNSKIITKASICESLRTIYEQTQEWQKAIEATQCHIKDKNNANGSSMNMDSLISHYYCELADESLQKGNLHEVEGFIAKANKAYKQSTRLMSLQGDIALHQKNYKESMHHYLKAIKVDGRLLSMLFNKLEKSASNSGGIETLQKELLKIYQSNQDNNVFEALLRLSETHGKKEDVTELVDTALKTKKLTIKSIHKATAYLNQDESRSSSDLNITNISQSLENHLQGVPSFRCEHCGYKMHDYLWRCPACNHWDTVDQA